MALAFLNKVGFTPVAFSNTDDFVVDAVIAGFYIPADAEDPVVVDGALYNYTASSADGSQHEEGTAAFTVGTSTLERQAGTVRNGSSGPGTFVNFSAAPNILMGGPASLDLIINNAAPPDIQIDAESPATGAGGAITIYSGSSADDSGGGLNLGGGGGDTDGGNVAINAGNGSTGDGGSFTAAAGDGAAGGGEVFFGGGSSSASSGGGVYFQAGDGDTDGGPVEIEAGAGNSGDGGGVSFTTGDSTSGNGGDITYTYGVGATRNGLFFPNLPTSDPSVTGAVWTSSGQLVLSGYTPGGLAAVQINYVGTNTGNVVLPVTLQAGLSFNGQLFTAAGCWVGGGYIDGYQNDGVTEIDVVNIVGAEWLNISAWTNATDFTMDALEVLTGSDPNSGPALSINSNAALENISLAGLRISAGDINFGQSSSVPIQTVDLSSLEYALGGFSISSDGNVLSSLDLSSLIEGYGEMNISGFTGTSWTYANLVTGSCVTFRNSANLTSISAPILERLLDSFGSGNCLRLDSGTDALTTLDLGSSIVEAGGGVDITSAALDQTSVDALLVLLANLDGTGGTVSYDNWTVNILGTSSAPSGTGTTAIGVLTGRGNTVNTN